MRPPVVGPPTRAAVTFQATTRCARAERLQVWIDLRRDRRHARTSLASRALPVSSWSKGTSSSLTLFLRYVGLALEPSSRHSRPACDRGGMSAAQHTHTDAVMRRGAAFAWRRGQWCERFQYSVDICFFGGPCLTSVRAEAMSSFVTLSSGRMNGALRGCMPCARAVKDCIWSNGNSAFGRRSTQNDPGTAPPPLACILDRWHPLRIFIRIVSLQSNSGCYIRPQPKATNQCHHVA